MSATDNDDLDHIHVHDYNDIVNNAAVDDVIHDLVNDLDIHYHDDCSVSVQPAAPAGLAGLHHYHVEHDIDFNYRLNVDASYDHVILDDPCGDDDCARDDAVYVIPVNEFGPLVYQYLNARAGQLERSYDDGGDLHRPHDGATDG